MATRRILRQALMLGATLVTACGGTVVFEEDGGRGTGDGGAGDGGGGRDTTTAATVGATTLASSAVQATATAASAGGTSPDSVAVSASTGIAICAAHEDCGDGNLCIFSTGECVRACQAGACDSCGEGSICDGCATSSCPGCADCIAACAPATAGRCDDDDRCPEGEACNFFTGVCEEACLPDGTCATPEKFCDSCATSSCCSCDSCSGLCIFGDD